MTLEEARDHIGGKVLYSTHPGEADTGVIITVAEPYVFVRYGGSQQSQATRPENLTLMRGGSVREHFRLNMAEAGFPMASGEEADR